MLSRDIETVLGGRYLDISVFPYSFSEYLKAVGVLLSKNWQYGRKANELQRNFGAPDKPCGVGRADANPKLLLNDT